MSGPSNFNVESFKQKILKEFGDKMQQMLRDMVAKIVEKRHVDEEDFKTKTIIGEPLKEKLKVMEVPIEPDWMKEMKKQMDQL